MDQSTRSESIMGSQTSLISQVLDDDVMFDRAEVRARLPLPAKAQMRVVGFVNEDHAMGVSRVESRPVLPVDGNFSSIDLNVGGQRF